MKLITTIFTLLTAFAIGSLAVARPIGIPPTKAINGATTATVLTEKEKEEIKRVTDKDLRKFSEKTVDDHVVQFRRGSYVYTMIPLRDLNNQARKESFDVAQVFSEKLMRVWLKETLNLRYSDNSQLLESQLENLSSEQIRNLLKKNGASGMPSAREIVEASRDAEEALKRLKSRAKFLVEFDDLISAYDGHQEEIAAERGLRALPRKAVPSALIFVASVKVPDQFLELLKSVKYVSGLSALLKGHINFTVTARPWYVVKRNLDTNEVSTDWHIETAPHGWIVKDFRTKSLEMSGPFRLGAGLIFGDSDRLSDMTGGVIGGSKNFGAKSASIGGAMPVPSFYTVKFGAITSTSSVKNMYLTLTRQFGMAAPVGNQITIDGGGVFNLSSITDRVKFAPDTLEDLLKLIEEEIPGAKVKVQGDQVDILFPVKEESTPQSSPETAPKQDGPSL